MAKYQMPALDFDTLTEGEFDLLMDTVNHLWKENKKLAEQAEKDENSMMDEITDLRDELEDLQVQYEQVCADLVDMESELANVLLSN